MCDCRATIEEKLTKKVRSENPDFQDVDVSLGRGYAMIFQGNTVVTKPVIPAQIKFTRPTKAGPNKGKPRRVMEDQTITANFCPFCGESLQEGSK